MRILIYINSLNCGGAERVISLLAEYWEKIGYEVTVLTNISPEYDFYKVNRNIKREFLILKNKNKFLRIVERLISLNKKIKKIKPDLSVSFMTNSNLYYIVANIFALKHVHIISERNDPSKTKIGLIKNIFRSILYFLPSALVVQSKKFKYWFEKYTLTRRIEIINNPIKPISKNINKNKSNKKFQILFLGRLVHEKGLNFLLDSFSISLKENPNMELLIVGEGPLYPEISTRVESNIDLKNNVKLLGKQKDVDFFYRNSDLLVIPSNSEGYPNVLLEGLSYNLNIISTMVIEDLIKFRNIDNIKFIEFNDRDALKFYINFFYKKNKTEINKSHKFKEILEQYKLEKISNDWIQLFNKLR